MGKYQRFEDLPVWQESNRLYQRVLDVLEEPNAPFSATFRNQLERAALCVSNCVADSFEGYAPNEVRGLLITARGAAAEVQSMVAIILDRPKVARLKEPLQQVRASAESCFRQLGGWKHALENPGQNRRPATNEESGPARSGTPAPPRNAASARDAWRRPA